MVWERRPGSSSGLRPGPSTAPELRAAYNDRHLRGFLRDRDRFYRHVARRLLPRGAASLLDVGCGGGYLLRESDARRTVGLEISDTALRAARAEAPRARLVLAQGERLPFGEGSFASVACLGNLEHFLDPPLGLREIARVLEPAGEALLLLPNSYYSGDLWRVIRTGYGPNHHQPLERFGTVLEWRDLIEENGLRVKMIIPYNRFKWWKSFLPRNLAYHFFYRCGKG